MLKKSHRRESSIDMDIPKNDEAEVAILCAALGSKISAAKIFEKLRPEHFYNDQNATIFSAMLSLFQSNIGIDLITLSNKLKGIGKLDRVGGNVYLAEISNAVPSYSNVSEHIKIVQDMAYRRHMMDIANSLLQKAVDEGVDFSKILDEAETNLVALSNKQISNRYKSAKEAFHDLFDELSDPKLNTAIPTGYVDLDSITGGFKRGTLTILAARPSVGKTTLALNFAMKVAETKKTVLIFSLEMSTSELSIRLASGDSRVNSDVMQDPKVSSRKEFPTILKSIGRLSELPIFIDDTGGITVLEMKSIARQIQFKQPIDLIIVDYLQLMKGSRIETRFQEVSENVRDLKALAKTLDVPIVALSQLSRNLESRQDKRPMLSDLRETGEIEQTADVVMFLHRDDYFKPDLEEGLNISETELLIQKNRNGRTGKIDLIYRRDVSRFESKQRELKA